MSGVSVDGDSETVYCELSSGAMWRTDQSVTITVRPVVRGACGRGMSDINRTELTTEEQKTRRLTQRFDYHMQL